MYSCHSVTSPLRLTHKVVYHSQSKKIKAIWHDNGEFSWTFETDIPHEVFEVVEDDDKYCRGIVFSMSDLE